MDTVRGSAIKPYGNLFSIVSLAMRSMAIINAASVMDKQATSTGSLKLIADVRTERPELTEFCNDLENRLNVHKETFAKSVFVRSNIIAHRSKQLTAQEINEKTSLDLTELAKAIEVWFNVAQELSMKLRGQAFWIEYELEADGIRLLKDLAARHTSP